MKMETTKRINILFAVTLIAALCSCNPEDKKKGDQAEKLSLDTLHFMISKAPEWDSLFYRKSGWFGGDGIFAVTTDGVESPGAAADSDAYIWFSDTMLGDIVNNKVQPGYRMINNSIAVLKGGVPDTSHIRFYWKKEGNKDASLFVPETPASVPGDYYWLGDGFVNRQKQNDLYIFGYTIRNISGANTFGFKETGNTLIIVPAGDPPPFTTNRQLDIPFFKNMNIDSTGTFGAGVFVNTEEAGARNPDGYVYIYGIRGVDKRLMMARVKPADIEKFDEWRFWDGKDWTKEVSKIATVTDRLSNELGLMQLKDGRYALIFQGDGLGKYVSARLSETPYGPFGRLIELYDCSNEVAGDKDFFPYNAKVHPVFSTPDELLISFNVNSFDYFNDLQQEPNLYRPRFIKVKILP